jgi:hypothetical protein
MFHKIRELPNEKLNKLCDTHGIHVGHKLPRLVKIHLVAQAKNISTCGGPKDNEHPRCASDLTEEEISMYFSFSMFNLYQLDGWTTDLSLFPPLSVDSTKLFLLNSSVITPSYSRAYKLCKPYKMMDFVHSVEFNALTKQKRSQGTNKDEVKMCMAILDSNSGHPFGGHCVCTAG